MHRCGHHMAKHLAGFTLRDARGAESLFSRRGPHGMDWQTPRGTATPSATTTPKYPASWNEGSPSPSPATPPPANSADDSDFVAYSVQLGQCRSWRSPQRAGPLSMTGLRPPTIRSLPALASP